jgi:hypothetical protein
MHYLNPSRIAIAGLAAAALALGAVGARPVTTEASSQPAGPAHDLAPARLQATTTTVTLAFRWSLVPWQGVDNVPVGEAIRGTGAAAGGNDISGDVLALFEWDSTAQKWSAYFVSGEGIPGANDLETLESAVPYWIAIEGPGQVEWTIATPE